MHSILSKRCDNNFFLKFNSSSVSQIFFHVHSFFGKLNWQLKSFLSFCSRQREKLTFRGLEFADFRAVSLQEGKLILTRPRISEFHESISKCFLDRLICPVAKL